MSWFSDNYEKAALGGAAVVALAFGFTVYSGSGAVDEVFSRPEVKKDDDVTVPGLALIRDVKASLLTPPVWVMHEDEGGRQVNLLTGVPLFVKKGDPENPVDLKKSSPVHDSIENDWWLKHRIDPGFSDSPDLDPDEDGFSNREEYVAQTDPTDFKSHPDPVSKLSIAKVVSTIYHVKPTDYGEDNYKFKIENARQVQRNKMGQEPIKKGLVIPFVGDLMKGRLMFKDVVMKEVKRSGATTEEKIWMIEDLKPNKQGTIYQFNRRGDRIDGGPKGIIDSTVELTLNALNQAGSPFKVEENTRFSLPYDDNAAEKPYLLKFVDVKAQTAVIEYKNADGKPQQLKLKYSK